MGGSLTLPGPLAAPLDEAGEDVLHALQTAGQRAWVTSDGEELLGDVWVATSAERCWLLAATSVGQWAVAIGDPAQVSLTRGWFRDILEVGPYSMPVPRRQRAEVEALIAGFRDTGGGGDERTAPHPLPPEQRAPMALPGIVPAWLAADVPANPDERWLHVCYTRSTHPFNLNDGRIFRAPILVASTDRRIVLAAHAPDVGTWWGPAEGDLHLEGRTLHVGPRALVRPDAGELAVELSTASSIDERWAIAARAAIDARDARLGLKLIAEAHESGHEAGWAVVARVLERVGRPSLAVAAAERALVVGGIHHADELAAAKPTDQRDLARQQIDANLVRSILRSSLAEVRASPAPDGMPWPPANLLEVWAAALASTARVADAMELWQTTPEGERRHRALATLLEQEAQPGAADAWERAANEQRPYNGVQATATLDRAIALEPTAARWWLRGIWAFEDGQSAKADHAWREAMALDPAGDQAPQGPGAQERAIGEAAVQSEAWPTAAAFFERAIAAEPTHRATYLALAEVLAERLGRHREAAQRIGHMLEQPPTDDPEGPAHLQQARYLLAEDEITEAATAVQAALSTDFLHAEVWSEAVELAPQTGTDPTWWGHVKRVLTAEDPGPGRAPVGRLAGADLDELHPGGVDFVERMRQAMEGSTPPSRKELIRGLEPARQSSEALHEAIQDLAQRLEIPAPTAYLFRGEGAYGCSAWATSPPVLLVGADHLGNGPRALSGSALTYLIAVELVHLACNHPVLAFDTDLAGTSRSMYRAFGRFAGTAEDLVDVISLLPGVDQLAKLQRVIMLSRKVFAARTAVDKVSGAASSMWSWFGVDAASTPAGVGREGLQGAGLAFRIQADRAALLLVGDLSAGVEAILRGSSRSLHHADRVRNEGLAAVLADSAPPAEAIRLASLVSFAASLS